MAALSQPSAETDRMLREFERRRDFLLRRLSRIPEITCVPPAGTFYAFPKVSAYLGKSWKDRQITTAQDLADYLLEEAGVAVVAGDAFGAAQYIRLSYATPIKHIKKGLDLMEETLRRLN